MMKPKHFLKHVRQRSVTQIMKQCASATNCPRLRAYFVMRAEQVERTRHHMHHTDRMRQPALFGALIGEHCEPELADSPQALKLGAVDQFDYQSIIRYRVVQRNDVVKRIAVIALRHS